MGDFRGEWTGRAGDRGQASWGQGIGNLGQMGQRECGRGDTENGSDI